MNTDKWAYKGKDHIHKDMKKESKKNPEVDALDEYWDDMKGGFVSIDKYFPDAKEEDGGSTPSQYGLPEGSTDLQDLIEHRNMNFAIGNIFKAAYRLGTKNNDSYELNKIIWFAQRELNKSEK